MRFRSATVRLFAPYHSRRLGVNKLDTLRITSHPILRLQEKREPVSFHFDGKTYRAYKGDTIASALLANGIRTLRRHESSGSPRGIFCNIGHCFECRVTVNGKEGQRACMTPVKQNMVVQSGEQLPEPFKGSVGHA
ncbi:(2Fe-2S)-binding protein [Sporolactobacillus sp. THM7-7]|nr:(2Fe-2S)-binding protein [Sporolactobacillus sp. THM7-7]